MSKKNQVTPSKQKPTKSQMKAAIIGIVLSILFIAGIVWGAFAFYNAFLRDSTYDTPEAKQRFTTLNNEVEKMQNEVLKPTGAVKQRADEVRGSGDRDTAPCGIDVHCPTIGQIWAVPMEPGKEEQFLTSTLQKMGYETSLNTLQDCKALENTNRCGVIATKGGLNFSMQVGPMGVSDKVPENDPAPKVWRSVKIRYDYYWENER